MKFRSTLFLAFWLAAMCWNRNGLQMGCRYALMEAQPWESAVTEGKLLESMLSGRDLEPYQWVYEPSHPRALTEGPRRGYVGLSKEEAYPTSSLFHEEREREMSSECEWGSRMSSPAFPVLMIDRL